MPRNKSANNQNARPPDILPAKIREIRDEP
jgi:hypothetical protein